MTTIKDINELLVGEACLDDHFIVKDILNGKKNLGEYKDFKKRMKMRYGLKKLYDATEDYLASLVLYSADDRNSNRVCVNLVDGGLLQYKKGMEMGYGLNKLYNAIK